MTRPTLKVPEKLRFYLSILMQNVYSYHRELDDLTLHFFLEPVNSLSIKDRCRQYASEIGDEHFYELAQYALNAEYVSHGRRPYISAENRERRLSFIRALKIYGFEVRGDDQSGYQVEAKFLPERLEETKEEVETLLKELDLDAIQGSLNIAEEQYVKGEFAKSLWNGRKALEDLFKLLAMRLHIDAKEFLSNYVKSGSARDLIKKIDWYVCKGHEVEAPEYEAIFGYHLVISAIYYLLLLFKESNSFQS